MALTYNKQNRDLSIKGLITFNNGSQMDIGNDDIVSYSLNSSAGSEGIPLGTVESASFSLVLNNVGRRFTPELLDNAEIRMSIGIKDDVSGDYVYSDCGAWYVTDSDAPEQSVTITLNGYDALATRFEAYYQDELGQNISVGDLVGGVAALAGIALESETFFNSDITVSKSVKWPEETKLRDIISYCAVVAAGFARINNSGQLEIVSYADGTTYDIGPDMYKAFTQIGGYAFSFNRIEAYLNEDDDERAPFEVNPNIEPNATNTIQLDYNPLLSQAVISTILDELSGINLEAGSMAWVGDPAVMPGDRFLVEDLKGATHLIMVNNHSLSFSGGLTATETCNLPALNSVSGETYSTSSNMYDSHGRLNATRISGLDKSIVKATIGHFENVTAETIETDRLISSYLNAIELLAKSIKSDSVDTNTLTAITASIIDATINKISSSTIETDSLYAAFANLFRLVANRIEAGGITADSIESEIMRTVALSAKTADFDLATIQNLLANALVLQSGTAGTMYINNLAVTSANLLSAVLGELILNSPDPETGEDRYYKIFVGSDGGITAELVTLDDDEIASGTTSAGQHVAKTTINVEELTAQNILGGSAILNDIFTEILKAGYIEATDAFIASAAIPALKTTAIEAAGDSMTFSANERIQFILGEQDKVGKWIDFNSEKGMIVRKPEWTDSDGVQHPASPWHTITDETGFHVHSDEIPGKPVISVYKDRLRTDVIEIGNSIYRAMPTGGIAVYSK